MGKNCCIEEPTGSLFTGGYELIKGDTREPR